MWYHAPQNNQIKGAQNMKPFPSSPFLLLYEYAKRNLSLFLLIALMYIASALAEKLVPYYFSKLVDLFSGGAQYEIIKDSIFYYVVMIIFAGIAAMALDLAGMTTSDVYFCPRVYKQIGLDTFDYLNHHSVEYFADNQAGALTEAKKQYPFDEIYLEAEKGLQDEKGNFSVEKAELFLEQATEWISQNPM